MTKRGARRFGGILGGGLLTLVAAVPSAATFVDEGKAVVEATAPVVSHRPVHYVPLEAPSGQRVRNESGVVLGLLRDHVVRMRDGAVTHLVLETGARTALVPHDRFLWLGAERAPVLALGVADLAALPAFDPERWRIRSTLPEREQAARRPVREVLGTRLQAARVLAGRSPFGMVRRVVLDPRSGRVAFALVWTGSDESLVAVPWRALRSSRSARPDGRAQLVLAKRRTELTEAPRFGPEGLDLLADGAVAQAVHRFYGVPCE